MPQAVKHWALTTLRDKLIKIGCKVVYHAWCVVFQFAQVAVSRQLFQAIRQRTERLRLHCTPDICRWTRKNLSTRKRQVIMLENAADGVLLICCAVQFVCPGLAALYGENPRQPDARQNCKRFAHRYVSRHGDKTAATAILHTHCAGVEGP